MTTTTLPKSLISEDASPILSPWQLAWRRFRKHTMALVALGGMILIMLYIWFGGLIFSHGLCAPISRSMMGEAYANCNDTSIKLQPPSPAHPFGTDTIGRDILARTIYGGQISLSIGLFAHIVDVIVRV